MWRKTKSFWVSWRSFCSTLFFFWRNWAKWLNNSKRFCALLKYEIFSAVISSRILFKADSKMPYNFPIFLCFYFTDTAYRFFGNQTHTDYFKLLRKDGQSLLIGARNVIYNISLPYLTENLDQVSAKICEN